jgi:hypothetical protein
MNHSKKSEKAHKLASISIGLNVVVLLLVIYLLFLLK